MYSKCQPEGKLYDDLRSRVVVANVTLSRVRREKEAASHPVRQHSHPLPGPSTRLLVVSWVEMEQHSLLLHSHQALVQPGTVGGSRIDLP